MPFSDFTKYHYSFAGIDPSLEEAATAFGMTKWEKLKKFELALAMPIIISGVRTSAVMIIGTATLAALIGAGGLGSFILLGIDRNNGNYDGAMTPSVFHYFDRFPIE
ncbi:Putative osmoprotectant uptake system permease protein yehW [Fusobacterium necrophorum subsp. necrophorum]|nr:Putative osmoprotectant uptake system permease protein yehW [Fusobacterium necrophorum subsp. necrophorum]